jgi:nucleotide-binding universal stress UspA family protein
MSTQAHATTEHPDHLKVLVAVDFSDTSRRALAWAFDYALRAPCEIHLVHVIETRASELIPGRGNERITNDLWIVNQEATTELERMVPDTDDRKRIGPIYKHVAQGRPANEIVDVADRISADLIVVGTHGRTGLARLFMGSVAEHTVRHAKCPVVCVKPGTGQEVK